MKEKILVTGGSGLLALNWVIAVSNRYSITLGLHTRKILLPNVDVHRFSLESVASILAVIEDIQPQVVIHAAGLTNIEECEANPDLARHINVELAENVARACFQLELPLAHISTDHLFSGQLSNVNENQLVAPQNVYAKTKAEVEQRVLDIYPEALVVRTNFYGWGPSYRCSFSDTIIKTLRKGNKITLFDDVFYTPILSENLAHAVHELLNRNANGIYHVVGDERISKYQFGMKVAEHFNLNPKLIEPDSLTSQTNLVKRPHDMSLSNQKTSDLLKKPLGCVDEHLNRLFDQEKLSLVQQVKNL